MIMHPLNGIRDKFSRVNNDTRVAHASRLSLNISTVHLYQMVDPNRKRVEMLSLSLSTRFPSG